MSRDRVTTIREFKMNHYSRWTMPVLRIGMGLFLAAWGVDTFTLDRRLGRTDGSDAGPE